MTTSLQALRSIRSTLLVKIEIAEYRTSKNAFPTQETILFNDSIYDLTTTDGVYLGMGGLVDISSTKNGIRNPGGSVTISLSGIPVEDSRGVLYSSTKGSLVTISRAFYHPGTNDLISDLDLPIATGGIIGRFGGYISTYSIEDAIDHANQSSTVTIVFECNPLQNLYKSLVKGLRTNPVDLLYRTNNVDVSFNAVPSLSGKEYYFGKPQ